MHAGNPDDWMTIMQVNIMAPMRLVRWLGMCNATQSEHVVICIWYQRHAWWHQSATTCRDHDDIGHDLLPALGNFRRMHFSLVA